MINFLTQLKYSKAIFIVSLIAILFPLTTVAQSITGISSAGAVSTGSGSAYNLKWTSSTTTTNIAKQIDLTLSSISGGTKLIFNAANTSSDWEVLIGSAGSNSWQSFCQFKSLSSGQTAETVYVSYTSTTAGTYTNTITIGFGSNCSSYTTAVTFNVTIEKTASGVYTWVGTSGVDSTYGRSDNWSPVRTSPATSDILVVDLGTSAAPVKTSINISGVTETIKQFKIFDYNTVDFVCSTSNAKWTIGNSGASGLGPDFVVNANSAMRKTGNATLELVIPSSDSLTAKGELHTVAGELKFTGAGKQIFSNTINTLGGTLSFIPSTLNTLYLDGVSQKISGTSGTLYIDSLMNVQVGIYSTGTNINTTLTLQRTLPLYSTLRGYGGASLISNAPASSSAADFNAWVPFLQLKVANKPGAKSRGELGYFWSITGGSLFEILGSNVRAYRMIGVPLQNGVNLSQFTDNIDITGNYAGNNKDSFSTTCSACTSSAFTWYESSQSWVAYSSGNNANVVPFGTGLMVFFRGTKNNNLGTPYSSANSSIIDFKGMLAMGGNYQTLDYNASGTDPALRGYNLISNPLASAFDFKNVMSSKVKSKFQIYDGRAKTYNVWDSTAGLSRSGSSKFTASAQNSSRIIEAGAAFFAVATGTGAWIEIFTPSPGLRSSTDHFKASSNNLKCHEMRVGIHFQNDSIPENDNTLIQTDMNYDGIVNEKDEFDSPKIFGGFLGIGPVTPDNVWMSIDRRPASQLKTYTIPLKVKTPEDNKYKISYDGCENNGGRYEVSLVDKLLNKVIPMRNGSEYLFSKTSVDALTENRFELLFNSLIEVTTGLKTADKNKFTVYPNPTISNQINIVSNAENPIQKVEIYSMDGKLVQTFKTENHQNAEIQMINFDGKGNFLMKMIGSKSVGTEIVIFK